MTSALVLDGARMEVDGSRLFLPPWKSAHNLPGASNWWDRAGVVDGQFTNLDPDQGPGAMADNPGGRAALIDDTGIVDVSFTLVWSGNHDAQAGPMVCINPDDADFGLTFHWETRLGLWVLWAVGRQPDDIGYVATEFEAAPHVDGVPVTIRMDVVGNEVKCYGDDVLILTATVPAPLVGSTIHGVSLDVNWYTGRPPNLPCAVAPYAVVPL